MSGATEEQLQKRSLKVWKQAHILQCPFFKPIAEMVGALEEVFKHLLVYIFLKLNKHTTLLIQIEVYTT